MASYEEQILAEQKKIETAKARLAQLKAKESEKKRKEDTRRKIQIGGTIEAALGKGIFDTEEKRQFLLDYFLKERPSRNGNSTYTFASVFLKEFRASFPDEKEETEVKSTDEG